MTVTLAYSALAALMTWPQARVFATHAADHQDVYFNMWRLRWIAHALLTSPFDLFNGNQFYPERLVLAYSDAMIVEGLIAAPLLWIGLPPVLVHNLMLLGAIVASAVGVYVLARTVTGSRAGAFLGGMVFAFAPYRIDHYMHMELQWTVWTPWAFWALQRTIRTRRGRDGVLTGVFAALQTLSGVYYGIFLAVVLAVVGVAQLLPLRGRTLFETARALALGGMIAAAVTGIYSIPYSRAATRVGERDVGEVVRFSAKPRDYKVATPTNLIYGTPHGVPERQLFPGLLPLLLALVGLLLVPPTRMIVAYVLGLIVAFELSLGMYGQLYPWLYEYVGVFRGLRAPARASVYCLLLLGVIAAHGFAVLTRTLRPRATAFAAALAVAVLVAEYWVAPLTLVAYDNTPPPLYRWLAQQPRGVVAEFPVPKGNGLPFNDARYLYMSTFHWQPILNGYSGYYPPSYLNRLDSLGMLPDERAIRTLRDAGAMYLVVHADGYDQKTWPQILHDLAIVRGLPHLGEFDDGRGPAMVFGIR